MEQDNLTIVAYLLAKGHSYLEITEQTGIGPSAISRLVRRGRDLGIIAPKQPAGARSKVNNEIKSRGITRGSIQHMLELLPKETQNWVLDNVPSGATIAEFTASIIIDAYHEEVGDPT